MIILTEFCVREHRTHLKLEHIAAVLLKSLSNHLGRHLHLEVLVVVNLLLGNLELCLILFPDCFLL